MSKQHRNHENKQQRSQEKSEDRNWQLDSKLEPGMLRFLAHVIENGMQAGLRTQEDFIRHFPPLDIMVGLTERSDLRANILVPTTGVRSKITSKMSAESAGENLQIALDEGETDATLIVSLFHPDDRVRYLDTARIWSYIIEPRFWTREKNHGDEYEQAKEHLSFILDRAIEDRLITYRDIVDGVTVGTMVRHLPLQELQAVIEQALTNSHSNSAFTEQDMLEVIPTRKLVQHIPLATLWDSVITPKVAERNNLATGNTNHAAASTSTNGSTSYSSSDTEDEDTGEPRLLGQTSGSNGVPGQTESETVRSN